MKAGFVSFVGRPQCREVDAAQPDHRYEAGDRVRQAADHTQPHPRREGLSGRAGRLHGHAGHPSAAAPDERADGPIWRWTRFGGSTSWPCWSTPPSAPAAGTGSSSSNSNGARVPVVLVLNKIDRIAKPKLLPLMAWYREQREFASIVPVSALTGDGVPELEALLLGLLPEGEALYPDDYLTDQPERFFVAETVREKLLQHTHAEIPFSSAVTVDQFEEADARGVLRLYCSIIVEQGVAETHRHRPRGLDDQANRHGGPCGPRAVLRREGLSRSAREGPQRVAGG